MCRPGDARRHHRNSAAGSHSRTPSFKSARVCPVRRSHERKATRRRKRTNALSLENRRHATTTQPTVRRSAGFRETPTRSGLRTVRLHRPVPFSRCPRKAQRDWVLKSRAKIAAKTGPSETPARTRMSVILRAAGVTAGRSRLILQGISLLRHQDADRTPFTLERERSALFACFLPFVVALAVLRHRNPCPRSRCECMAHRSIASEAYHMPLGRN